MLLACWLAPPHTQRTSQVCHKQGLLIRQERVAPGFRRGRACTHPRCADSSGGGGHACLRWGPQPGAAGTPSARVSRYADCPAKQVHNTHHAASLQAHRRRRRPRRPAAWACLAALRPPAAQRAGRRRAPPLRHTRLVGWLGGGVGERETSCRPVKKWACPLACQVMQRPCPLLAAAATRACVRLGHGGRRVPLGCIVTVVDAAPQGRRRQGGLRKLLCGSGGRRLGRGSGGGGAGGSGGTGHCAGAACLLVLPTCCPAAPGPAQVRGGARGGAGSEQAMGRAASCQTRQAIELAHCIGGCSSDAGVRGRAQLAWGVCGQNHQVVLPAAAAP